MFYANKLKGATPVACKQVLQADVDRYKLTAHNVLQTKRGLGSLGKFEQVEFEPQAIKVICKNPFGEQVYAVATDGIYRIYPTVIKLVDRALVGGGCTVYDKRIIFSSKTVGTYAIVPDTAEKFGIVGCNHIVNCCGRLIGVDGNAVRVCEADCYDKMTSSDKLETEAPLTGAAVIGHTFYALGDTCYSYTPDGELIESQLHPCAHNVGHVEGDSVVTLKKRVVFATHGGLRIMSDGNVTDLTDLDGMRFEGAVACAFRGQYLLSCKRGASSERNDITLLIDVEKRKTVGVFEFGFDSLYSDGDVLYGVQEGKVYRYSDEPSLSCVTFGNLDMGNGCYKLLRRFVIRTRNDADVWISSDGVKRLYFIGGSDKTQSLPVYGRGKEFTVEIHSDDGFDLDYIRLDADTFGEE